MFCIDLENHFYDQSLIEALTVREEPPLYDPKTDLIHWSKNIFMPQGQLLKKLLDVGNERMTLLDRLGITHAVLSTSPGLEQLDEVNSIKVCETTNAALYELTKKYPGKILGSAALPVKNVDAAVAELEKCVKEYHFVAWHTHSNYGDTAPDDLAYRPIFQKASELGIYIYLHPQLPENSRYENYGFTFAGPGLGFTVDTLTTVLRMIVSGLFDEIPSLKIVLGHLGEGLPFLLERIENRIKFLPNDAILCKQDLKYYFKHNIWVTTSGNMSSAAFRCTKDVLGMDRILFASDHPFENASDMMEFLRNVPMTEAEREKLFYKNAEKLMGIKL